MSPKSETLASASPTAMLDVMALYRVCIWALMVLLAACAFAVRQDIAGNALLFSALAGMALLQLALVVAPVQIIGLSVRTQAQLLAPIICLALVLGMAGPAFTPFTHWYALPVMAAFAHVRVRAALIVLFVAIAAAASLFLYNSAADATPVAALLEAAEAAVLFIAAGLFAKRLSVGLQTARDSAQAMARRDELTSLLNLRAFLDIAERAHERAVAAKVPYAILMVDIDALKSINEQYGHEAGDRAIAVVADVLLRLARSDEIIGRFSADKFVLLLPSLAGARADETARRIRNVVFATTMNVGVRVVRIKANVGIAKYPVNGVTVQALLKSAEDDMIVDKNGRERPKQIPVFKRRSGTTAS